MSQASANRVIQIPLESLNYEYRLIRCEPPVKTAFVTGTSKGLGLELAKGLLIRGYRVSGLSRSSCPIEHENYLHLVADITGDNYRQCLGEFVAHNNIRQLDILINNAGTRSSGSNIEKVDVNELRKQFELHCVAVLNTVQVLRPALNGSKIVNITSRLGSSIFNQRGDFTGRQFSYGYRIAKAAQNMLSLCLTHDEKLSDNLILSIIPGLLRTDSGADDARFSAAEGAQAVLERILRLDVSGIYHAFAEEAAY